MVVTIVGPLVDASIGLTMYPLYDAHNLKPEEMNNPMLPSAL